MICKLFLHNGLKLFVGVSFSLAFLFCLINPVFAQALPTKVRILTDTLSVHEDANIASSVLATVRFNQQFETKAESGDFYEIYYTETQTGFVLKVYVQDASLKDIPIVLDCNATIIKTCGVYEKVGNSFNLTTLPSIVESSRVKILEGYDGSKPYTKISFSLNEDVLTYYIPTSSVDADGVSLRTIISIMLIVSCVTVFWLLYSFFRGKHKTK